MAIFGNSCTLTDWPFCLQCAVLSESARGLASAAVWSIDWTGLYGLGVDEVLEARLVTTSGDIVEADEEFLWSLQGDGFNFGTITEIRLEVHDLSKTRSSLAMSCTALARHCPCLSVMSN